MAATEAQRVALRWLIDRGWTDAISAGTLAVMYEERARVEHEQKEREYGHHPTAMRVVSWKRTSGRVFNQMRDRGLVEWDGWDRYTPRYKITDEGRAAAEKGT